MMEVPPEVASILRKTYFAYFCTVDSNNQAHVTPMFFYFDEENRRFYFITSLRSKKIANMRINPGVSFTVDVRDDVNPFGNRGVMVQGIARFARVVDVEKSRGDLLIRDAEKVYGGFEEKYPTFQPRGSPESIDPEEGIIKVIPEKIVYWRGPEFSVLRCFPE
ncbi:MAG: pyridoxamine 5'-phosphate oxidase family protein [Candidatus Geothermarchaeales archaeon]